MLYLYFIWSSQKPYEVIIIMIPWSTETSNNMSKVKHHQQVVEVRLQSLSPASSLPLAEIRLFLPV